MGEALPTDIPRLLREALESLLVRFRPLLAAEGLTEQQWRVLRALDGRALSQVELARRCAMRPASLSGVLTRMEQDGLVERRRSTDDRRRVDVVRTGLAETLMERLAPQVEAVYTELVSEVGEDTLASLAAAAVALRDRAERHRRRSRDPRRPGSGSDLPIR